jgi:hypothetical protein
MNISPMRAIACAARQVARCACWPSPRTDGLRGAAPLQTTARPMCAGATFACAVWLQALSAASSAGGAAAAAADEASAASVTAIGSAASASGATLGGSAARAVAMGLAALLALYLGWLLSQLNRFLTLNKIPCHLPGTWLAGNAWDLASLPKVRYAGKPDTQALFKTQAQLALDSGHGLFRIALFRYVPFLSREWVVVADWELAKELLSQGSFGKFDKGSMYKLASPLIGHGLLAQPDGAEWKQTRRMVSPGFHPRMLRLAVAVAVETTAAMCERWDRNGGGGGDGTSCFQSNLPDEMLRLTIDVLGAKSAYLLRCHILY